MNAGRPNPNVHRTAAPASKVIHRSHRAAAAGDSGVRWLGGLMARRFLPKLKDRRKVPIPGELRDSLREVFALIQRAKHDPDIVLDYGDAIQLGAVCGGRHGEKPRPYVLTYFPEREGNRSRWYLTLHRTEIEDIGDGRMTEIMMFCCTSAECHCKFREENDHCFFCDYEDDEETRNFKVRLESLARRVNTKEEWVADYLREKPDATAASLIGDYNPIEGLGERLGWFSFPEAKVLIAKARVQG
jgi:hypothetical protein